MEARPPYLFGSLDPVDKDLRIISDMDADTVEMTVRGRWNQRLGMNVYTMIRKCVAGHPATLIVDVRQLDDFSAASATMWLAADRAANAMHPPVQLVLCVPPATPRMVVTVGRRATGLRLSVRDGAARLPYLRAAPAAIAGRAAQRGSGLRVVDAAATAWGAMPTHDGKLVWATLRDNHRAGSPR